MAISQAQPLLLLFVSLFFSRAALGTSIEVYNCQKDVLYDGAVTITKVEIFPYPIKFHDNPIFKITGVTSQSLTGRVLSMFFNLGNGMTSSSWYRTYSLCDVTKCPIEPGPFVLTLANVYAVRRDDHLSGENNVTLDVRSSEIASYMCATFKFQATAFAEFTNIPITDGVNVNKVEIWPFNVTVNDNPVFRITAVTPKNISSTSTISARMFLEGPELYPRNSRRHYKLCDSTYHCPIVPGTFVLTFPHPYWRYKMEAGRYRVEVLILNQNNAFQVRMNLLFWFSVSEV